MEIPPALERALIPLVMLLTYKTMPNYRIWEEIYPEHRIVRNNSKYFIIQKAMFTCLFEGATSNRAELDYRNKIQCSSQGVSILYI